MALRGRSNILRKGRGFTAPVPTVQPVKEEVVSLASPFDFNATPFASTVTSPVISEPEPIKVMGSRTEPTTTPKLTESTMYGTQHKFQPKTPELLQYEANLKDPEYLNKLKEGLSNLPEIGPIGSGITPEFLETIEPKMQDMQLETLGLTREEVNPDVFKDTESFVEFKEKATEEMQDMQLGNLQTLASEDPTQFSTVWPTLDIQDQIRYVDELNLDKDDRLNTMAQSLQSHANNYMYQEDPIHYYVVDEGKVWQTSMDSEGTLRFFREADIPGQEAGKPRSTGSMLEFALNNPVTQIAGIVNPAVALATTGAKLASGVDVSPVELASSLMTGLNMTGVVKPPVPNVAGDKGTGLFGTTYGQTQTALNVAAAGDAKGAALALVGNDLIKGGLDKVGLDQATIERAGIQYDDFEAGVGKTVQKLAAGEELDEALAHGLGKYIREGGTLGSIDLPETNIDLGVIEDVVRDLVRPIGEIGTALANVVEDGVQAIGDATRPIIKAIEEPLKPIGDVIENVGQVTGDVVEDVAQVTGDVVEDVARPVGDVIEDVAQESGDVIEDVAQATGDVLSDLDTAVRKHLPKVSLSGFDLPFELRPTLVSDTGEDFIPSPTRTTDSLFNDELFQFETEIGISDYPIESQGEELELFYPESALQLDYGRDADNFFENTIYEAKPRSYNF